MVHFKRLVAVLALAGLPSLVMAASEAREMLDSMSKAFRELEYQGVFTYEYGAEMESMRIFHAVRDGLEIERLVYLNGEPREIFRAGHSLNCVHPGDQILRLGHTISSGPFARSFLAPVGDIADHYVISLGGEKRIAGRLSRELQLRPKDKYRNGFWFYLDSESSLLLKSIIMSPEGRPLERFQFASISIGASIADADLQFSPSDMNDSHQILSENMPSQKLATVENTDLAVTWLPPGFTIAARSESTQKGGPLRLAMYTDGLATISVFVEAANDEHVKAGEAEGRARHGATVAYTRKMTINNKPYSVTVVGEVPVFTAARVARHVSAVKAIN